MDFDPNCIPIDEESWLILFQRISPANSASHSAFRSVIGCTPQVVLKIWTTYLEGSRFSPSLLLYTLSFLFAYPFNEWIFTALWGLKKGAIMGPVWDMLSFLHNNMNEVTSAGFLDYKCSNKQPLGSMGR